MVNARTILITIGIVFAGILLISGGLALWSLTETSTNDFEEEWLQNLVTFANDLGNVAAQGIFYFGIIVILGAVAFLYINRNS